MYHIYSQIVILKITVALTILYANLRRNVIHVQLSHNMIQYNTICFFLLKQKCQFILLFWEWEINTGWWLCLLCYEWDDYFKMTGVWPACTECTFYCLSLTFTFLGNNIYIRSAVAVKTQSPLLQFSEGGAIWTHCWGTMEIHQRSIWLESTTHTVRSSNFPLKVLMWINLWAESLCCKKPCIRPLKWTRIRWTESAPCMHSSPGLGFIFFQYLAILTWGFTLTSAGCSIAQVYLYLSTPYEP